MDIVEQHRARLENDLDGLDLKVGLILSERIDQRGKARKFKTTELLMRWLWHQGRSNGVQQTAMYNTTTDLINRGFFSIRFEDDALYLSRAFPAGDE